LFLSGVEGATPGGCGATSDTAIGEATRGAREGILATSNQETKSPPWLVRSDVVSVRDDFFYCPTNS